MSQLAIKSLTKSYGAFKVFDGLNLAADAGEIVVIFGGSGTGKTILLRLIAGVEEPTAGAIEIGGHDVSDIAPEHRGVGMAFQNFALFPHMNASENIATPLRAAGADESKVKAGVAKVAKLLKIDHVLNHAPRELSNGQKQRTALVAAAESSKGVLHFVAESGLANLELSVGEGDAAVGAQEFVEHLVLLAPFALMLDGGASAFVGPARHRETEMVGKHGVRHFMR